MSSSSNYYKSTSTTRLPGRDVKFSDLEVWGDAEIVGNIDVGTIDGAPYHPSPFPMPTPVANKILRTNGASIVSWGDLTLTNLPIGTSNQLLVTNLAGTAAEWTNNPTIGGSATFQSNATFEQGVIATGVVSSDTGITTLGYFSADGLATVADLLVTTGDVTATLGDVVVSAGDVAVTLGDVNVNAGNINVLVGDTVVQAIDIAGEMRVFGNSAGTAGVDVLWSDGAGNPPYWDPLPASVQTRTAKYYDNNIVDMNSAAAVLLFSAASVDAVSAYVSYTSGALGGFTLSTAGVYDITVKTLASTAQFRSQINIKTNAAFRDSIQTPYDGANTNPQSVVFRSTIYCNAADVLTVVSQPIVAGVVNTTGNDVNGISQTTITITWLGPT